MHKRDFKFIIKMHLADIIYDKSNIYFEKMYLLLTWIHYSFPILEVTTERVLFSHLSQQPLNLLVDQGLKTHYQIKTILKYNSEMFIFTSSNWRSPSEQPLWLKRRYGTRNHRIQQSLSATTNWRYGIS